MMSVLTTEELHRYQRHIQLPDFGLSAQEKLRVSSVCIVGVGGLGSPAALYLAAAGIGRLGLIDDELVELSNVQRQILHFTPDVGRSKLVSASEKLSRCNPHVQIDVHPVRLKSNNALEILAGYDVIIDATDNFATRYLLNDGCVFLQKPLIYGSIYRYEGQMCVFDAQMGPCYRCLYPTPPPPESIPNCSTAGVLGVLPGFIASMQVMATIALLTGISNPMPGRLTLFDLKSLHTDHIHIPKHPTCPVCGTNPTITSLIDYDEFCTPQTPDVHLQNLITYKEFQALQQTVADIQLVDVREQWEFEQFYLEGATLIPLAELSEKIPTLSQSSTIVLYCESGGRSRQAQLQLQQAGFEKVFNLKGGVKEIRKG